VYTRDHRVGAIFVDVTEQKEAEQTQSDLTSELRHQALHDSLTGLPIGPSSLTAQSRCSLVVGVTTWRPRSFIDVDNFKDINDTLGHRVGDELLVELARRLTLALRETDTVGRLGGDEFVVLTESLPWSAVGRVGPTWRGTIRRHRFDQNRRAHTRAFREPFALGDNQSLHAVTASIGIATGPRATVEELLRDADVALYEAKGAGKQRYTLFQPGMRRAVESHVELQKDLGLAVERMSSSSCTSRYQDRHGAVVGVEALLRWQHPIRGVVMPDEFIPVLEESGLILTVGPQVLHRACQQAAECHRAGYDLSMS